MVKGAIVFDTSYSLNLTEGVVKMPEKRMLIIPSELIMRIDENRGGMSRSDFIDFLIESRFNQDSKEQGPKEQPYITKEELQEFEQGVKGLLQSFLEFFVSYGLELGKKPMTRKIEELDQKLGALEGTFVVRKQGKNNED